MPELVKDTVWLSDYMKQRDPRHEGHRTDLHTHLSAHTEKVTPRHSTMDIIAKYLGSLDYETLTKELGEDAYISLFAPADCIEVQELAKGSQIQISYEPN